MKIIGIDYSTDIKKCGLSIGEYINYECSLLYTGLYNFDILSEHFSKKVKVLISIDSPLGWPQKLGLELIKHTAGSKIVENSNTLFRRYTDIEVKRITGKQSLDVGADKIARTAYGAVNLLEKIRNEFAIELPLSWDFEDELRNQNASVIEVYPAVTLKQNKIRVDQYKGKDNAKNRGEIIEFLTTKIKMTKSQKDLILNDDNMLDSVVCVLAGMDFIRGYCLKPNIEHLDQVKKEGWIWFKER